jgi:tetratricopeptide (TPR) repeat protein
LENIGLHDKVEIGERVFDIHTGIISESKKVISEVFEKGMFLTSKEMPISLRNSPAKINYEFLNNVTKEFHNDVIDELEALYLIDEKLNRFKHAISRFHLGCMFLKRNLFEEATRQFKIALEQDPKFVKSYIGLGISYLKSKIFDKALNVFQKAMDLGDKYPDLYNFVGLSHLFLGDFDKATTAFKAAIDINPNYSECQFNMGVALYKSALEGAKDPRAVAVPARIVIYLKQVRDLSRYQQSHWQKHFTQLLDLLKDNNHEVILPEIENFQLKLVDFAPEKDKIYEFYLRFLFGGNELSQEVIDKYESYFISKDQNVLKFPDYWNELGVYNLIKSRSLYLQSIAEFEKALEIAPGFKDAKKYRDMIKSNEKGFLILLRAILK